MNPNLNLSKEDVLYAFSIEPDRDSSTLEEYLRNYPQYKEDLVDLSIDLFLAPKSEDFSICRDTAADVDKSWEKFQSILNQPRENTQTSVPVDPFMKLSTQQFKNLARELNVNRAFLSRLRDRTIEYSSIPLKFVESIANALGIGVEALSAALDGVPRVSSTQSFKAKGKPSATSKISFKRAVEESSMSDQQKAQLRKYEE